MNPFPALVAFTIALPAAAAEVRISATYLARIAAPPGSVLDVRLIGRDASGAHGQPIGHHRRTDPGNPPYLLVAESDGAGAVEAVRVVLRLPDGAPFFAGTSVVNDGSADVVMHPDQGPETGLPLLGPLWRLFSIDDTVAASLEGERDIPWLRFEAEGRLVGASGCNRMGAGFASQPDGSLAFTPGFGTMMACEPAVMDRERAVLDLLGRTTGYRIDGDRLSLLAADAVIALFVAEPDA